MNVNEITFEDWLKATFPEWGTWLNEEIAEEQPEKDSFSMWWLGCVGLWIKTDVGTNLTIDLWCGTGKRTHSKKFMPAAHQFTKMSGCRAIQPNLRAIPVVINPFAVAEIGAFLCTHFHSDHIDPFVTAAVLKNCPSVSFIGPRACIDLWRSWNVPEERLVLVRPGDTITVKDVKIQVLDSFDRTIQLTEYPVPTDFTPTMADKSVNYLIETSGGSLYHAGDSHYSNGFARHGNTYKIDVAVGAYGQNPVGLTDKMSTSDFLRMGEALRPEVLIPLHYETWSNFQTDLRALTALYEIQHERLGWSFRPFLWQVGGAYRYPMDREKRAFNYERGFPDLFAAETDWPCENFF